MSSPAPLNVTFVVPYFYPAWQYGGQPRSAYELARGLVLNGHHVRVLTTDSGGDRRLDVKLYDRPGGIEVMYYRNISNRLAFRQRVFIPPRFYRQVSGEVAGCDLLHIHELRSTLTVPAYNAARKLSKPFVVSPHGGLQHLGKAALKSVFDGLWGRRVLRDASALAAVSPTEQRDALSFGVKSDRIALLPNAIDTDPYSVLPEPGAFRKRLRLDADDRFILFLGRLNWVKGADLLLRAFAKPAGDRRNIKLLVAGNDDGQESELRRLASNLNLASSVVFTGFLDQESKLEALVDSEVLVIPSRSEVFAITALEGLLCGTPVLISSVCGLYPLPGSDCGVHQFLVGDVDALSSKLEYLLGKDPPRFSKEAALRYVQREFSPAAIAACAEQIYRKVLAESRGAA